ncbi:MAG: hypothetical protein AB1481_05030 [Candidatus Omnitrophota bacterium]
MQVLKNKVVLILSVLCVVLFVAMASSCSRAYQQQALRTKEMSARLDSEEKLNKLSEEKAHLEEKIKSAQKALGEEKTGHESTKKALTQEQMINQSLKEELAKVNKLKEALEEDLKKALDSGRSGRLR